jgi:hypothetical protein
MWRPIGMGEMTTDLILSKDALERVHDIGPHYAAGIWHEKLQGPAWETLVPARSEGEAKRRFCESNEYRTPQMIAERLGWERKAPPVTVRPVEGFCVVDVSIDDDEVWFDNLDATDLVKDVRATKALVAEFDDAEDAFDHRDARQGENSSMVVCWVG